MHLGWGCLQVTCGNFLFASFQWSIAFVLRKLILSEVNILLRFSFPMGFTGSKRRSQWCIPCAPECWALLPGTFAQKTCVRVWWLEGQEVLAVKVFGYLSLCPQTRAALRMFVQRDKQILKTLSRETRVGVFWRCFPILQVEADCNNLQRNC